MRSKTLFIVHLPMMVHYVLVLVEVDVVVDVDVVVEVVVVVVLPIIGPFAPKATQLHLPSDPLFARTYTLLGSSMISV